MKWKVISNNLLISAYVMVNHDIGAFFIS